MRVSLVLIFLTFVGTAWAAPQTQTTLESKPLSAHPDPDLEAVPASSIKKASLYWVDLQLGALGGNYLEKDRYERGFYISARYLPLIDNLPKWDYEISLSNAKLIGLSLGHRWHCCPGDEYQPYARLSANMFIDGNHEIGGLLEIRRLRLRAGLGLGRNFVSEFGVGYAVTGVDLYGQWGYRFEF